MTEQTPTTSSKLNAIQDDGWTALQRACDAGNLESVRSLLESGADPNLAPINGAHPLQRVIDSRASTDLRVEAFDLLLEHGADPDSVTNPSLLLTCTMRCKKQPELKRFLTRLLDVGASDLPNEFGWTAGMIAHWLGRKEIAEILPESGDSEMLRRGAMAAVMGDEETLRELLDAGLDPDSTDPRGISLLATSCTRRHWPLAELLLARGADPLATGSDGYNAAASCYLRGRPDLMWEMFETAGQVNDASGSCRALVNASGAGDLETVRRLLELGANPNSADTEGQSSLLLAVAKGQFSVASLLLEQGADPNTGSGTKTVIDYAVAARNVDLTRELLESGASPNGNAQGFSALGPLISLLNGSTEKEPLAELGLLLLQHGASPAASTKAKLERLGITPDEGEEWSDRLQRWFHQELRDAEAARLQQQEEERARTARERVLRFRAQIERIGGTLSDAPAEASGSPATIIEMLRSVQWPDGLRVTTEGTSCIASLTNSNLYRLSEFPDSSAWMGDDRPYGLLADDRHVGKMLLVALEDTSDDPEVFVLDHDGDDEPPSVTLSELLASLRVVRQTPSRAAEDEPSRYQAPPLDEVLERRPVYLIERNEQAESTSRIGGLPPALPDGGWPEFDGRPMLHVATIDVRDLDLSFEVDAAAVSVFAHSITELEAFAPGSESTHVAWLTDEHLNQPFSPPEGAEILDARGVRILELCTIERGAETLIVRFPDEFGADDIQESVSDSPEQDASELLGELLADEGEPSYLGGWSCNPSSLGSDDAGSEREEGPFVMRLTEALVGSANFAGGGWLFVHQRDAWAER